MKNILSRIKNIQGIFRYGGTINPTRDWFVILGVAAVILILSVLYSLWIFSKVTSGEVIGSATTTPAVVPTSLDSVTPLFQKREEQRLKYISEYSFIDPKGLSR